MKRQKRTKLCYPTSLSGLQLNKLPLRYAYRFEDCDIILLISIVTRFYCTSKPNFDQMSLTQSCNHKFVMFYDIISMV